MGERVFCHFDPFERLRVNPPEAGKLREKSDLRKQVILSKAKDLL